MFENLDFQDRNCLLTPRAQHVVVKECNITDVGGMNRKGTALQGDVRSGCVLEILGCEFDECARSDILASDVDGGGAMMVRLHETGAFTMRDGSLKQ